MKYIIIICAILSLSLAQNSRSEISITAKVIPIKCSYEKCQDYLFYGNITKQSILLIDPEYDSIVSINIYNKLSGNHIITLNNNILRKGRNEIYWNGLDKDGRLIQAPVSINICSLVKI